MPATPELCVTMIVVEPTSAETFWIGFEHLHAAGAVERSGWLVAEQHFRPLGDGAGHGDALLLAAGKLGREMIEPIRKPDELQRRLGGHRIVRDFGDEFDVLARREAGRQIEELEDETDMAAPVGGQLAVARLDEIASLEADHAGGRPVEAPQNVQQRRLARARRTQQHQCLAGRDVQVDAAQGMHVAARAR